eukprot:COSAG02_NODE_19108_length_900_cov_0.808989_1_plen_58_part_10
MQCGAAWGIYTMLHRITIKPCSSLSLTVTSLPSAVLCCGLDGLRGAVLRCAVGAMTAS